jgi:hypothetical protein
MNCVKLLGRFDAYEIGSGRAGTARIQACGGEGPYNAPGGGASLSLETGSLPTCREVVHKPMMRMMFVLFLKKSFKFQKKDIY